MRTKVVLPQILCHLLKVVVLIVFLSSILSCATKTRTSGINNQSLPIDDQKAIYDLLVRTALDKMRSDFNWYDIDCYVEFPKEITFGQQIISSYDFPVPLRPSSECRIKGKGVFAHIYGKKTKRWGILLYFSNIDNVKENTVRCGFGWYEASLSGHIWSYRIEKIDGKWVIKETLLEMIS